MIYYALPTIILLFVAAFLMWFFIFGRKAVQKEDLASPVQKAVHILTAVFSVLISTLIGYDIHKALSFLETFGDTEYLHALFYPVSALTVVFLLIPFAVVCAKREPVIPGVSAILSSLLVILLLDLLCISLCMMF